MKNTFRKLAFGLGLTIASITAQADLVTPLVSLQENAIYDEYGNWSKNQYVVTNNSPSKNDFIVAFGVTNPAEMSVWTTRSGWAATTMSKNEWNSGLLFNAFYGEGIFTLKTGAAFLGSFESLFGSEDSYVNFYWLEDAVIGEGVSIGVTGSEFYFSAPPASQYAAFDEFERTIFQSFNNVPEPGSMALLGLAALAGLTVTRRRRTS